MAAVNNAFERSKQLQVSKQVNILLLKNKIIHLTRQSMFQSKYTSFSVANL